MPPLWVPQWKADEKDVFLSCRNGGNTSSELSGKLHYRGVLIIYRCGFIITFNCYHFITINFIFQALSQYVVVSSPQYSENTAVFSGFPPWREPRLRHFAGYPFGASRKKTSTIFYGTAFFKDIFYRPNDKKIFPQFLS